MSMQASRTGRPLTGRMVLAMLLLFFGTVIAVNLVMVRFAIDTFSGRDQRNAYLAGLTHNRLLAAAREQEKLGWSVDARLDRAAPGRTVVTLERGGDKAGARNLTVYARFEHPTVSHADRVITLDPVGDDLWRGAIDLPAGVWDFVIDIRADGEKKFRSRERIEVRDTKLQVNG